jgi:predicted transcriptional regulator
MSDSDDLLGKADAFLKRYRASGTSAREDVPVLTEVIAETAAQSAQSSLGRPAQVGPTRAELRELEQRLKQSILDAIGPYVANILEEPLRARLEAHLQRTLDTLSSQVRADIETLIREAVARAVEVEVARMRGPSRGA